MGESGRPNIGTEGREGGGCFVRGGDNLNVQTLRSNPVGLEHAVQAACEKEFAPWLAHMHGHTQVYNFHINKEVPIHPTHTRSPHLANRKKPLIANDMSQICVCVWGGGAQGVGECGSTGGAAYQIWGRHT